MQVFKVIFLLYQNVQRCLQRWVFLLKAEYRMYFFVLINAGHYIPDFFLYQLVFLFYGDSITQINFWLNNKPLGNSLLY